MNELVSCIIPVYNGAAFLGDAITSVLEQTHTQHQIIVVDDGSTDETRAVAEAFGARIEYVWQPNAGQTAARMRGIELMRGSWVTFLDADDLWLPVKTAVQLEYCAARPGLDATVTLFQNVWQDPAQQARYENSNHPLAKAAAGYNLSTLLARRELWERVGPLDTRLRHAASLDWFLRAEELGCVIELIPQVLLHRRLHTENLSRNNLIRSQQEHLRVMKAHMDKRRASSK